MDSTSLALGAISHIYGLNPAESPARACHPGISVLGGWQTFQALLQAIGARHNYQCTTMLLMGCPVAALKSLRATCRDSGASRQRLVQEPGVAS